MKLYKTKKGNVLEHQNKFWLLEQAWDELINRDNLHGHLAKAVRPGGELSALEAADLLEIGRAHV